VIASVRAARSRREARAVLDLVMGRIERICGGTVKGEGGRGAGANGIVTDLAAKKTCMS
jgi:hypothetical protein